MNEIFLCCILFLIGYLIGSISIGYLVASWHGIPDVRLLGSGSTGATNIARALGIPYFFLIFFVDFLKSFLTILFFKFAAGDFIWIIGVGLIIGNGWPYFIGFKGGKGVATAAGIFAALIPKITFFLFILWGLSFVWFRIVGIASVIMYCVLPVFVFIVPQFSYKILLIFISFIGLVLHRFNIKLYLKNSNRAYKG